MPIHIYLIIIVISSAVIIYNKYIFVSNNSAISYLNATKNQSRNLNMNTRNNIFLFICFFSFLIVAGFRGDFTTDYNNYVNIYNILNHKNIYEIFTSEIPVELFYAVMNKIIAITLNDHIYIFIISAFVMLHYTFKEVKKYSEYIWISVLIYLCIGSYFVSFNLMRQVMAAAIVFGGSRYLYNREFIKFLLWVTLASLFHSSALIMIPFYFIFNIKWNKSIAKILSPVYILSLLFTYLFTTPILNFVRRFFYSNYSDASYGMSVGLGIETIGKSLIVIIYVLWNFKLINMNSIKERIWFNAIIYNFLFSLLGLRVEMLQRFHHFFAPFILLIVPMIVSRKKTKESKIANALMITFFLIAYSLITMNSNYYFIF